MNIDLTGKVAIVTGASRGIGEAIARAFAAAGASVLLCSRKIEGVEAIASSIRDAGGDAVAVDCHTGHREQVQALVERAIETWGRLDIVVSNAATNPHFGPFRLRSFLVQ